MSNDRSSIPRRRNPLLLTSIGFVLLGLTALSLASCEADRWSTHRTRGYAIDLPDYLSDASLNPYASLQKQNLIEEVYVFVIDEARADLPVAELPLEEYMRLSWSEGELEDVEVESDRAVEIHGLNGIQREIVATLPDNGLRIYFLVTFLESPTHFFQIITWTLEDEREAHGQDLRRMANSFREEPHDTGEQVHEAMPGPDQSTR